MTKADFKWHSSGLGSFPLASLSHLLDTVKANDSFGQSVILLMPVSFSNIFLLSSLKGRKVQDRFTVTRKTLSFSLLHPPCHGQGDPTVMSGIMLLVSCEASGSRGRGVLSLQAVPSCCTRLKDRTQFNNLFQVRFLTKFFCSKVIKDGIQAAVQVG